MVFPKEEESLVYGVKFSSVGPGRAMGSNSVHEPSNMDLVMKLHYLKGVYFFSSQAVQGLTIMRFKEAIFYWLNEYFQTCGRFRRSESGRPFIKCNDCGARFIEAHCNKTISEWLEMKDWSLHQKLLVSQHVIGPEIEFSPLVFLQITHFKCGGISLGLSWAHVLGDAFSASDYINRLGQYVTSVLQSNNPPNHSLPSSTNLHKAKTSPTFVKQPLSLKPVDPVGDNWVTVNNCKMELFSFLLTPTQIRNLQIKILDTIFESICALILQCIAKMRKGSEPKIVTICKNDQRKRTRGKVSNSQVISSVEVDISTLKGDDPKQLAKVMFNQALDETSQIEEAVEKNNGVSDFIVYGGNLTFVDWQEADIYGIELQGYKPELVSCSIQGVGVNGAVFVLPGPNKDNNIGINGSGEGKLVTVVLPEHEIPGLKSEMMKNDLLLDNKNIE